MHPGILPALQQYLNDRTLGDPITGKANVPGYLLKPYVAWTPKLPRADMPKDMMVPLAGTTLREDIAVAAIVPGGSRMVEPVRSTYDADQPRGGQIREMTIYLPIFFRSLKALPYEAAVFWYEDLLVELLGDIDGRVHPAIHSMQVGEVVASPEDKDFFVIEATASLRYVTISHRDPTLPLKAIHVTGLLDILKRYE